MTFNPTEYDEAGQWVGTCSDCGTSHDGYPPDSFGAQLRCLRLQAERLGAGHLVDQIDAGERERGRRRDEALRGLGLIP